MAHFCVAASVVGNRAVCVGCQRDTQSTQHSDGSDRDAVQTESKGCRVLILEARAEAERQKDSNSDYENWDPHAIESFRKPSDDHRRWSSN